MIIHTAALKYAGTSYTFRISILEMTLSLANNIDVHRLICNKVCGEWGMPTNIFLLRLKYIDQVFVSVDLNMRKYS